jgi:hypothetical protein
MEEGSKQVEVVVSAKKKLNHNCYIFSLDFTKERIEFAIG